MPKEDIKSLTLPKLAEALAAMGERGFRAEQIYKWLHARYASSFDEMTDISASLRDRLNVKFYINMINIQKRLVSAVDGTVKYLYGLRDGNTVEAVLMRYKHGNSLCVSTQAGCKMGCAFCASAPGGLIRGLTASEMLDEVYTAAKDTGERVSGVVLMGIGEPLDNYGPVMDFLRILSSPQGMNMGLRHVSLSTCGLVNEIDMLAGEGLAITLSVSLHAPNDDIRKILMPVAKKWPMDELLEACGRYFAKTGRRVSFEYALIEGVNDRESHAAELGEKLTRLKSKGMRCHVNLIPANSVEGKAYRRSGKTATEAFAKRLESMGVTTTVRRRLGADINAACGQLRRGAQ